MIRRFGDPKRCDISYRHRPGAYVILPRGNHILLTHQAEPDSEFQLPGGGIDPGESPIAALHREVREETGWRVANLRRLGAFQRFSYLPDYEFWAQKMCHIYVGNPVRPLGPPTEAGHTARWVSLSDSTSLLANEGDRYFVSKWLMTHGRTR